MNNDTQKILKDTQDLIRNASRGARCLKYEQVTVDDSPVVTLTPPTSAYSAVIIFEADATSADTTKIVYLTEDGTAPTSSSGMPFGHLDTYEVTHIDNIKNFKVIGIEAGKTHKLNIQYYSQP